MCIRDRYRTLKPGGTAVVTTWKHMGYVEAWREELAKVKPDVKVPPGGVISEGWLKEETIKDCLVQGGFDASYVKIKSAEHSFVFGTMTADGSEVMKGMLMKAIYAANDGKFTDEEKKVFNEKMEERLQQNAKNNKSFPMVAWVAAVTK